MTRKATKTEQAWLSLLAQLPCLICQLYHHIYDSPSEIHHIDGQTKPDCHRKTLALCNKHHRHKDNDTPKKWVSRHGDGKSCFESRYMPENGLLKVQIHLVQEFREKIA